jgi:PAS domain S-box-containing protein
VRRCLLVARLAAAVVVAIGGAVLVGWAAGIRWLQDPIGGLVRMVPNTALLLVLSGLSLGLSVRASARRRWAAKVLAIACVAMTLTTLAQDVVGRDFGIDRILFDVSPARPAVASSIGLLLSGVALLSLDVHTRWRVAPAELLATAAATVAWLALGGYLYGAIQFYVWSRAPHVSGMAIHSSIALIVLSFGIAAARPEVGAMAILASPHVGGQAARKMLPIALSIPVLGFLATQAQRAGLYQAPGAAVVEAVAGMSAAVAIALAVGQSLDRTDARRRRIERETREWKRFFDRATFGAAFGTVDARLGCVNDAFARMHGYTIAELEGRPATDLFPPERRGEVSEKLRIVRERGWHRWVSEHIRKDGTVFPVAIDLSAVRDDAGRVLYHAAYVQDVTEERQAEAALARLASLVQSTDDVVVAEALDGTVLDWNPAAERVLGYSAREMVGRPISAIVPEELRVDRAAMRAHALAGETVVGVETLRVCKDGRRIPVALTLSPIRDAAGRVVGCSTIVRDISALKLLERERQEWAAVVAHDLRQPAATIRLAAEILARSEGEPKRQTTIDRIRKASDRLERMIGDLLDVAHVETGRLTVRPEPVEPLPLIEEVAESTPEVARRCRTRVAPDAGRVCVDAGRFVQVLSNLLSNAQKYGDPDTPIEVSVERADEMVQISVTNEGPGIAPDEISKLFSRFARTRSAQSGAAPGLGLGLYICRGIVEAHGGKLWVESVPGQKTHFRLTLPRSAGDGLAPVVSSAPSP